MVKEYLLKTRDEFLERRVSFLEELTGLQNHVKENEKLIQLLEESNDSSYASFTPREVNSYAKQKIQEIHDDQKNTLACIENVKQSIADMDAKIDEINRVLLVVKSDTFIEYNMNEMNASIQEAKQIEGQRIGRKLNDATVPALSSLIHKAELCTKLIDVDPNRCRMEMDSLNNSLHTILSDICSLISKLSQDEPDDSV